MWLIEFKSLCVPAGLEYFWVRSNISRYCGALSRVFVGLFFGESSSTFPLRPALPQESHECGAAGCDIEDETADQFERRREAKPLDHVSSFSCWCQHLTIHFFLLFVPHG